MDPYIEACELFEDLHLRLAVKISEQLADSAPDRYLVRAGKREYVVLVEPEGKDEKPFLPDVSVSASRRSKKSKRPKAGGGTMTAEPPALDVPMTMSAFIEEEHREAFVEVLENAAGEKLVTAIEILSPSNKRAGTGREVYLRKRQSLMLEGVNFIEIDLLRGGKKMPMRDDYPPSPYTLLVARAKQMRRCLVWPAYFRIPLPPIPVPLLPPDADLTLHVQPLLDDVYRRSRYDHSIDYSKPLSPPLDEVDAAWLRQRLAERHSSR
jgi:hypothetical protein